MTGITSISGSEYRPGKTCGSENAKPSRFDRIMNGLGTVIATTGKVAATMIPGASVLSGLFDAIGDESWMGRFGGMTPMEMLGIQQSMLQESRVYTLLSNVMRIRHDAAMNAIRNIK
jgi:hypothetical protein